MAVIPTIKVNPNDRTPLPPPSDQTANITPASQMNPTYDVPESSHHPALRHMGVVDPIRITQIEDTTATLVLHMAEICQFMQVMASHIVPQQTNNVTPPGIIPPVDRPRRIHDPNGYGAFPGDARSYLSR